MDLRLCVNQELKTLTPENASEHLTISILRVSFPLRQNLNPLLLKLFILQQQKKTFGKILPESLKSGNQTIRQSDNRAIRQVGKPESLLARNLAECVRAALEAKAAKKESFRFPEELMAVLEDLPYEIKKTYGKRLTKTAVFVAAFATYLWEFKHKGQESLLYKHLIEAENA